MLANTRKALGCRLYGKPNGRGLGTEHGRDHGRELGIPAAFPLSTIPPTDNMPSLGPLILPSRRKNSGLQSIRHPMPSPDFSKLALGLVRV
jgi:hypothetical protein